MRARNRTRTILGMDGGKGLAPKLPLRSLLCCFVALLLAKRGIGSPDVSCTWPGLMNYGIWLLSAIITHLQTHTRNTHPLLKAGYPIIAAHNGGG